MPRMEYQRITTLRNLDDGALVRSSGLEILVEPQPQLPHVHPDRAVLRRVKSREYSDYQVSVLEVAGTAATREDVLAMESRWKKKLKSQEMGLNRN